MKEFKVLLDDVATRSTIVSDCEKLIDDEVHAQKGFSGIAVKTAFSIVKTIKPSIIRESVDGLLNEFVAELQPFFESYQTTGQSGTLESFFGSRSREVADKLLNVTDRRARRASNKTLVKAYEKLRPKGLDYVANAVPNVGRLLDRYVEKL